MFEFDGEFFTHMPFAAPGAPPDFRPMEFCCIRIGEKWKIHRRIEGAWRRIPTGLPEDATECSPCGVYDPESGTWGVSFIAGGAEAFRPFYLYRIDDLEKPRTRAVIAADVGFTWKSRIVYAGRRSGIFIVDEERQTRYDFPDVEFWYRVSPNVERPQELIVSGAKFDGETFSWLFDPVRETLREVTVAGEAAYKGVFYKGTCYYAQRCGAFEERHIVASDRYSIRELPYSAIKTEEPGGGTGEWEFE